MRFPSPRLDSIRLLAIAALCSIGSACGGIQTVSKDGYRATILFSSAEKYAVAVRGESRRVEGGVDGAPLIKIHRPDLKKIWQFRPGSKRLFEETWTPTDESVPGYPLDPRFDWQAYSSRFHGEILKISDAALGGHPCDRYQMDLPSGDRVTIWVARDYEGLPVRIEHWKKKGEDEYEPFSDVRLTDVRVGADPGLFEKPKGYTAVASYEELRKGR